MSTIALGTVRSCGATTLGLALASTWPSGRRVLLVEADPAGGTLAAGSGWPPEPGLVSLAAATRRAEDLSLVFEHCHELPGGAPVLAAPASGEQACHVLAMLEGLLAGIAALDVDVLLDCGRLGASTEGQAFARFSGADRSVLVARPRLADLHAVGSWLTGREAGVALANSDRLGLALVGDGPYPDAEVTEALGVEVLGRAPFDPEAADALLTVPATDRALRHAPLVRAARTLAAHLSDGGVPTAEAEREPLARRAGNARLRPWRTSEPGAATNGAAVDSALSNGAGPNGATTEEASW